MLFWESYLSSFWHYDKLRNAECKSKCIDINWNFWWWKRDNFVLPAEFLHLFNAGILASFISFHWSDICTMFCVSFYPIICPKKKYVYSEKQVTAFLAKNRYLDGKSICRRTGKSTLVTLIGYEKSSACLALWGYHNNSEPLGTQTSCHIYP